MARIPIYQFDKNRMPELIVALEIHSIQLKPMGLVKDLGSEGSEQSWSCSDINGGLFTFCAAEPTEASGLRTFGPFLLILGPSDRKRTNVDVKCAFERFEAAVRSVGGMRCLY